MASTLKCSLGIALSLVAATAVSAEETLPRADLPTAGYANYGYGYGWGGGTTAHESINRGRATVIKAVGERNLLDAEALRSLEEARSRNIDNTLKAHDARLARKRLGIAERNAELARIQARRSTYMALNDAELMLQSGVVPSAAQMETRAAAKLRLAINLLENGRPEHAVNWLHEITHEFANTAAATEAARILKSLNS